ncbi:MAG TPA: hypothetical protein VFL51_03935 [Pseudolabrys sp.]|nr:hypothetical protein [Pseudolabrys sp.]
MNDVRTHALLLVAVVAVIALLVFAWQAPGLVAAGWLIALVYVSAFPLGSLALLMIHRLTGGRWGESLAPILKPMALSTPLIVVFLLLLLPGLSLIYPWQDAPHNVGAIYLNFPSFTARALIALVGLSIFAIWLTRLRPTGVLPAAGGLLFYAIIISVIPRDWFLSTEPPFASTSFGASTAVVQMMASLALVALLNPGRIERRSLADLGGLLLALTLAITYIDFMAVLVIWYGDLPHKVFWFAERIREPWRALAVATFILASLLPVVLLLFARVRASRRWLRLVGALILIGLALYDIWLLAPAFGAVSIAAAALAFALMASLIGAYVASGWHEALARRWSPSDGR